MRGSVYREGYHDYNILTGGLEVYPRLVAAEHSCASDGGLVSSGLAPLDQLWGGGLERGSSTLLLGPAGVGKSSVGLCYAVEAARRGEYVACFVFEEWIALACKTFSRERVPATIPVFVVTDVAFHRTLEFFRSDRGLAWAQELARNYASAHPKASHNKRNPQTSSDFGVGHWMFGVCLTKPTTSVHNPPLDSVRSPNPTLTPPPTPKI